MTDSFLLNWSTMAVSLFNMTLMFWLGVSILLNAEQRTAGTWIAGGTLLTGGIFFFSHSAILGHGVSYINWGLGILWSVGVVATLIFPYLWYILMYWYAGSKARDRHKRLPALLSVALLLGLAGVILRAVSYFIDRPIFQSIFRYHVGIFNVPVTAFSIYLLGCIALSIDLLRKSGRGNAHSDQISDTARQKAGPWLIAASLTLLLVSGFVAWAIFWIKLNAGTQVLPNRDPYIMKTIARFDLIINLFIASMIIISGKPIVSYELFTGRALPRKNFLHYWRYVVVFGAGFGIILGLMLSILESPVYMTLISLTLVSLFYALFSWTVYVEYYRFVNRLRPLIAGERPFDGLSSTEVDIRTPFYALCQQTLQVHIAYLIPFGGLFPLIKIGLAYPDPDNTYDRPLTDIFGERVPNRIDHYATVTLTPLDPDHHQGARWAVPLWTQRGAEAGALLMSDKINGNLFTREEVETARLICERLLDARAIDEFARRLMALQRQKIIETQLMDQKTRRALHDDVLPLIHSAMISLDGRSEADGKSNLAISLLTDAHQQISSLLHDLPTAPVRDIKKTGLINALKSVLKNELHMEFDRVEWSISIETEELFGKLPDLIGEVLFSAAREVLRNVEKHAKSTQLDKLPTLSVTASVTDALRLIIKDNGTGSPGQREKDKLVGGHGLALHSTLMTVIGGSLSFESVPNRYTQVTLTLPPISEFD
ncbi:MAG: hypothetical protein B6244_09210 [Candidatus Cloacimonetes bacterium 4572_55]|nr:MAG: hypothetical protein B6244_09210 [Candidatus Cloacimonetes bacterium 4572_55]